MRTVRAETIGTMAEARLTAPGFFAKVVAAVSHAVYLTDREGEVLWVSPSASPPHRRAILAAPSSPAWPVGTICRYRNGLLWARDGSAVDMREASTWRAPSTPRRLVQFEIAALALRAGLGIHACAWTPTRWTVAGRPGVRSRQGESSDRSSTLAAAFADEATESISELAAAADRRDASRVLAAATGLVGLGEGLTPSGDDLLGGYLFTLRQVDAAYPSDAPFDWVAVEDWLTEAADRTNAISFCLLSDLARGHAPEPLHRLVDAALSGAEPREIARYALRVAAIGQSSGREMLTGMATAMGLFSRADDPEPCSSDAGPASRLRRGRVDEATASRGTHAN